MSALASEVAGVLAAGAGGDGVSFWPTELAMLGRKASFDWRSLGCFSLAPALDDGPAAGASTCDAPTWAGLDGPTACAAPLPEAEGCNEEGLNARAFARE